MSENKQ